MSPADRDRRFADFLVRHLEAREAGVPEPEPGLPGERDADLAEAIRCFLDDERALAPVLRPLVILSQGTAVISASEIRTRDQSTSPPPSGEPPGSTVPLVLPVLPGYDVLAELGRGGMGIVYQARDLATGQLVAIKMLHEAQEADIKRLARFHAEMLVLGRLNHPHVVRLLQVGERKGSPYLVMELLTGGNLMAKLGEQPQPARDAALLVEKLAHAIQAAHEQKIVHRDLKPANVLLTAEGEPKVTDFGLAKLLDTEVRLTTSGAVMGTPAYMAPEQAGGDTRAIGPATDIHALGLILYESLAGVRAFQGPTVVEVLDKVRTQDPTPPSKLQSEVPRDLETICLKCLHKDPARRYASAAALADDLRRYLEGRPIKARPVGLWERAVKWRRRHPVVAALLGVVAGLALFTVAAGWWYWDSYKRPKIEYFARLVKMGGVSEGRLPLTPAEAGKRLTSYRITRRAGRVEQVEVIDGTGKLTTMSGETPTLGRAADAASPECRYVYRSNDDGTLAEEVAHDRFGNVLWTLHYTTPTTAYYRNTKGYPRARTGSGAAYVEFVWSPQGYEQEVHFLDRSGSPHPNDQGVYGIRWQLDERGFITRETFLNVRGEPTYNRKQQFTTLQLTYDEQGRERERVLLDGNDKPVVGSDGYARRTSAYDAHGNLAELVFFDADGEPAYQKASLAHIHRYQNDDRGFPQTFEYVDARGRLMTSKYGQARLTIHWDAHGNATEFASWGTEGQLMANRDAIARSTVAYDDRDNPTEWHYWDTAGNPTPSDGFAHVFRRYDENGRVQEEAYTDAAGRPVLSKAGYATLRKTYDDRGNLLEETYLGVDQQQIILKAGYAGIRYTYDDRDNALTTEYLSPVGQPVFGDKGYARTTRKYDERGHLVEQAFFGPDGSPVYQKESKVHRLTSQFDERGNAVEVTTYGANGRLLMTKQGFARMRIVYDDRDLPVVYTFQDVEDRLVMSAAGCARKTVAYDARGQKVEEAFFGPDGQAVTTKDEGHRSVLRYDDRGKPSEIQVFGADGRPTYNQEQGMSRLVVRTDYGERIVSDATAYDTAGRPTNLKLGYARAVVVEDLQGRMLESKWFGPDGRPTLNKDGYARTTQRYDERGNLIEMAFFGTNDQPVLSNQGFARVTMQYDERGNTVENAAFGIRGEPVCDKEHGVARVVKEYDSFGRMTSTTSYGVDGKPAVNNEGYAISRVRYNDRGDPVEETYFGPDGKPTLNNAGVARMAVVHDARGNATELRYFGKDDQPTISIQKDAAIVRREFDDQGRVIAESFFGPDGKPTYFSDGFARATRKYDEFGNVSEEAYFDADGKPMRNKYGVARVVKRYDSQGNQIETSLYGPDGTPTPDGAGLARRTWIHDERGNLLEEARFNVQGQPAPDENGVARVVYKYNDQNQKVEGAFYNAAGRLIASKLGFAIARLQYDARGNLSETSLFGPDGKLVRALGNVSRSTFRFDEQGRLLEEAYFDADGRPSLSFEGVARVTNKYDPRGVAEEVCYFGTDGKPALHKDGYSVKKAVVSADLRRLEETYCGTDGRPARTKAGYARKLTHVDERGNKFEEAFFGPDGKPTASTDGFARVVRAYDERNRLTGEAYFGPDDKPARGKNGYARYQARLDELGRILEVAYFGPDGRPTPGAKGACRFTATYDDRGQRTSERYFGPDDQPILLGEGNAGFDAKYNSAGRRTEATYLGLDLRPLFRQEFDEQGRLVVHTLYRNPTRRPDPNDPTRFSPQVRRRFDERGREVEMAYFDAMGKPVLHPSGFARVNASYDASGLVREERYFGLAGEPVMHRDGGAFRAVKRLTPKGITVGLAMFGRDGRPLIHPDGFASWQSKVDANGRVVETAYFGPDGKPTLTKQGYARFTFKYDARGNRVEETCYGVNGRPAPNQAGWARYRARYNAAGQVTEEIWLDAADHAVANNPLRCARATYRYDARGNQTGVTLFGPDGRALPVRVIVGEVVAGSIADRLGVKAGDLLETYDGKWVQEVAEFLSRRRAEKPGSGPRELVLARGGRRLTVRVPAGVLGMVLNRVALPDVELLPMPVGQP
jgi:YD repeat-containing protein